MDDLSSRLLKLKFEVPGVKADSVKAMVRVTPLIVQSHRLSGSAESYVMTLSPREIGGEWYLPFAAREMASAEIFSEIKAGPQTIYCQTRFSIYPSIFARFKSREYSEGSLPEEWPVLNILKLRGPNWMSRSMVPFSFEIASQAPAVSVRAWDRGIIQEIKKEEKAYSYRPAEDPELNGGRSGGWKESVILAELGPSETLAFSFDVYRNQSLHVSRPKGVALLFGSFFFCLASCVAYRRKGDLLARL
jgi:hypothetical protein